jgi:hypothetical protein
MGGNVIFKMGGVGLGSTMAIYCFKINKPKPSVRGGSGSNGNKSGSSISKFPI